MDLIQQIGAIVGLASFFGLAVLAFLYFAQARHVRDLEEKATYVPEDLELPAAVEPARETSEGGAAAAQPVTQGQPQLQAARQVELARAAADRRTRFEQRRRPGSRSRPAGQPRRMPEPRAMAAIAAGFAVLAVGIVFGADRILGGGDNGSSSATTAAGGALPEDIQVAVLNGTPVPGAAANFGQQVRNTFKLGAVTNTETPFDASVVMYDTGHQAEGQTVAKGLGISKIEPMSGDVKKAAGGAPVAFVVGADRAGTQ
jgi:LytR cell envelope-related transcriptional attenuator